jgi:hypothetical protein
MNSTYHYQHMPPQLPKLLDNFIEELFTLVAIYCPNLFFYAWSSFFFISFFFCLFFPYTFLFDAIFVVWDELYACYSLNEVLLWEVVEYDRKFEADISL